MLGPLPISTTFWWCDIMVIIFTKSLLSTTALSNHFSAITRTNLYRDRRANRNQYHLHCHHEHVRWFIPDLRVRLSAIEKLLMNGGEFWVSTEPFSRKEVDHRTQNWRFFSAKDEHKTLRPFWGRNTLWRTGLGNLPPPPLFLGNGWSSKLVIDGTFQHKTLRPIKKPNLFEGGRRWRSPPHVLRHIFKGVAARNVNFVFSTKQARNFDVNLGFRMGGGSRTMDLYFL